MNLKKMMVWFSCCLICIVIFIDIVFSPNGEPDLSKQNLIDSVIERIEPTGWFYYRETFE